MRTLGSAFFVGGLTAAFVFAGCGGGGSSSGSAANGGPMFVQTCSLGCSSGSGGQAVHCGIAVASPNSEIAVYFSEPVDPNTLSTATLQLVDVNSGQVPIGTRFVDANNPRRVVFRPSVTFDVTGSPNFGFEANTTYRVTIPGESQGDNPPYIESTAHKRNRSRMQCDIQTTAPVVDLVPGSPVVTATVDLAILATPNPDDNIPDQPADDAINVWRGSTITLTFNDVMNPATLVNQATHQPTFLSVRVDADGNLSTTDDQDVWPGTFDLSIDLDNLTTTVVYTPTLGLPSGGASHNRRMIVEVPVTVQDLAENPLSNFGLITFVPETTTSGPVTLPDFDGENFTDTANLDVANSGADWGSGRLARGFGGGSGRLGKLRVRSATTISLSTDSQTFPITGTPRDLLDNALPGMDYDPENRATWPSIIVTDGAFEFSSVTIEAGGVLRVSGSRPARLFSRGTATVLGTIDVSGTSNSTHDSSLEDGQPGASGGPGAGRGGAGGDRVDNSGSTGSNGLLATPTGGLPAAVAGIVNPGADLGGRGGQGVGIDADGQGSGGLPYPPVTPVSRVTVVPGGPLPPPDLTELSFTNPVALGSNVCYALMVSTPGGGGGYSLVGHNGVPITIPGEPVAVSGAPNFPPPMPGSGIGGNRVVTEPPDPQSDHMVRRLAFETGSLRGGSGGGGAGTSLFRTTTTAGPGTIPDACQGPTRPINAYFDHAAGGGGGGGGALQFVSGRQIILSGQIDAGGGTGGSAKVFSGSGLADRTHYAAPGGGGSGGAVRLQGVVVQIATSSTPGVDGHVDVSGGQGGSTEYCWVEDDLGSCIARGGAGSPGLIRIEDNTGGLTRLSEASKLLPYDGTTDLESRDWLSVGAWLLPRRRPESFSGSVSCWMSPPGSFFVLQFTDDDLTSADPADHTYGWNMEVLYDDGGPNGQVAINYRGPDTDSPFDPSTDLETLLHNNLNYGLPVSQRSYFAVRFQGARLRGDFHGSLCNVNLDTNAGTPEIVADSLTPWVRHPADLNDFNPRPNMVRFSVVFDTQLELPGSVASFIRGVRNLRIETAPD